MENTMEIMVNENQEVIENAAVEVINKVDIMDYFKKGGKAVAVTFVAYGLYKGITKGVPALWNGGKKLYKKMTKKDAELTVENGDEVDVDNYEDVDDFENEEI